ncbi:uncharacterized protein LOC110977884 [Acanthaster planci]|uniref:Uncharacterized protein LOC110977884 n=1 Tax=Acanthaster planci TaxID=133434 RepID=A0A8B7Y8M3_ACAPL|nr:uncharacterized protein LOC110977884 [Acanthaster planci]
MITCLVVLAIEILHIAAPWVKDRLAGSSEPIDENTEAEPEPKPEPQPTTPKVGKLRLTNSHRLILDMHICHHKTNQTVLKVKEAMVFGSAVEAESAEIERQMARERRQVAVEKSGLEAEMTTEKAEVVAKIEGAQCYMTESLAPQQSRLRAQASQIKGEMSLRMDEYDGVKQAIENKKILDAGYRKQTADTERLFKVKSAHQVTEKAIMNKQEKDLTAHINKLEKRMSTVTSYRLPAVNLKKLNMHNEEAELHRATDEYKCSGIPRNQLIIARGRHYGTMLANLVFTALLLVFNIGIFSAAFKLDLMDQLMAHIMY